MLHPHLVTANLLSYENTQIVQDELSQKLLVLLEKSLFLFELE